MKDYLSMLFFIVIAFITGLSIAFNICSMVGREEKFFKNTKSALTVYGIAIIIAILFTIISYSTVTRIQRVMSEGVENYVKRNYIVRATGS